MEVLNQSFGGYSNKDYESDDDNQLEKTFVTIHVDSFNEKDFTNFLNCLDTINESNKKRKNREKVIKNYCIQVPYIDNSIRINDDDNDDNDYEELDEKCNEMKNNISQMFSYFEEDVQFNFDDIDHLPSDDASSKLNKDDAQSKIRKRSFKKLFDAENKDSKPVIRGVVKKPNAPCSSPAVLHKNQVDKIMNEFNRVKINYYSKDNCVEFTDIDYFYCDSDLESTRSFDKVGRLNRRILSKFEREKLEQACKNDENEKRKLMKATEIVPKNSVKEKITMFSKLDIPHAGGFLTKSFSAPTGISKIMDKSSIDMERNQVNCRRMHGLIKNTSSANKNQNKCFIKDINNSINEKNVHSDKQQECMLNKIVKEGKLKDSIILMQLERIVNQFGMSLLFTINGLMSDNAFTLGGRKMNHLKLNTVPSLVVFNKTFDSKKINNCTTENVELSVVQSNQIQLQMHVKFVDKTTGVTKSMRINVIFMAKYETDCDLSTPIDETASNSFNIYFTSFFEPPENELQKARESNVTLSEHQLRVQASLQKLNIPDWYKQYSATGHNTSANTSYYKNADVSGMLKKRNSDIGRWQGLNSKTTSLSSLGSNRSDRSPVMLSPSAHSHHGGQTGFSRWSTSHLNSSQTSPSVSARSSFVRNAAYASTTSGQSVVSSTSQASEIRNSFRKPYLGWRSQEKLNQPRTAHERLASSLMSQKQAEQPVATPEIQSSIKEVTSAIVHYVNDQTNRGSRSRSVSPSTRCWLESSFVGTKPLESPQTPGLENQFASTHKAVNIGPMSVTATNYDSIRLNGIGGGESTVI
ncbi:unnamed protein product [Chironomus riparius]|uniref:Uncharacterized protein n=1 Tax=Chironomus riparius TaxID=315576 RepID=A0A9N9RTX7_9DIPT|nr:unnamed protein product [Chironomus riparius]